MTSRRRTAWSRRRERLSANWEGLVREGRLRNLPRGTRWITSFSLRAGLGSQVLPADPAPRARRTEAGEARKRRCYKGGMIDSTAAVTVMNDDDLIASTREIARKSNGVEAELLLYLGEIDARKVYRERASPSMIAFCMREFNFSEGAAAYRIHVARFARELPAILDALRSGAVHLSGLRVLVPHLDEENHERLLVEAAGKSKREIEEMAARLSPKPPVPDSMRKLPARPTASLFDPLAGA